MGVCEGTWRWGRTSLPSFPRGVSAHPLRRIAALLPVDSSGSIARPRVTLDVAHKGQVCSELPPGHRQALARSWLSLFSYHVLYRDVPRAVPGPAEMDRRDTNPDVPCAEHPGARGLRILVPQIHKRVPEALSSPCRGLTLKECGGQASPEGPQPSPSRLLGWGTSLGGPSHFGSAFGCCPPPSPCWHSPLGPHVLELGAYGDTESDPAVLISCVGGVYLLRVSCGSWGAVGGMWSSRPSSGPARVRVWGGPPSSLTWAPAT